MSTRVLVTGGAGFIGSKLVKRLLSSGCDVRVLDVLLPQVHGPQPTLPRWLREQADVRIADIRSREDVEPAVRDVDAVVHLAAETGTAQSMFAIHHHVDVNVGGTAMLLEALKSSGSRVRKLIIASSRAVYGEGQYSCERCGEVYPNGRSVDALGAGRWEPPCPRCGGPAVSVPTDEDAATRPSSTYGVSKLAQEQLALAFGQAFGIGVVALRFQNVYGAGQALANPYTGILTHLFGRARSGQSPLVFEDGLESRDFVHVDDAVCATVAALDGDMTGVFNVGSGVRTTILELAERICTTVSPGVVPRVTGQFRLGDIRHALADVRRASVSLGYSPSVPLSSGLDEFLAWAKGQQALPVPLAAQ